MNSRTVKLPISALDDEGRAALYIADELDTLGSITIIPYFIR